VACVLLVLIIGFLISFFRRRKPHRRALFVQVPQLPVDITNYDEITANNENSEFKIIKHIGGGEFGQVFLALWKNEQVAIKVFKNMEDKEQMKEYELLKYDIK
jgi:hypothetical protein